MKVTGFSWMRPTVTIGSEWEAKPRVIDTAQEARGWIALTYKSSKSIFPQHQGPTAMSKRPEDKGLIFDVKVKQRENSVPPTGD